MKIVEIFKLFERHTHVVSLLSKYADNPSIYITFTDLPKVGINPQYNFDTPAGIYAYPLQATWDEFVNDDLPFASDRKYVQVLQSQGNIKDVSDYKDGDFEKDKAKLIELYGDKFKNDASFLREVKDAVGLPDEKEYDKLAQKLFNKKTFNRCNQDEILAIDDKIQDVFKETALERMIYYWSKKAFTASPVSHFWNVTRNIAIYLSKERMSGKIAVALPQASTWNKIMRNLGYAGISDTKGRGVLHSNEPKQAVFFSTQALKHVETLINNRKYAGTHIQINSLSELTTSLTERVPNKLDSKHHSTVHHLRIAAWIDKEWPRLFTYGHSDHFEIPSPVEFWDKAKLKWPSFVEALLVRNFSNYPLLANEIQINPDMKGKQFANPVLYTRPRNPEQIRIYADTILGTKFFWYLAEQNVEITDYELQQTKEKEYGKNITIYVITTALKKVVKSEMDFKSKIKKLRSFLNLDSWYRITQYVPMDELETLI